MKKIFEFNQELKAQNQNGESLFDIKIKLLEDMLEALKVEKFDFVVTIEVREND